MLSSSAQENARRQLSLKSTEASYIQLQGGTAGIVGIKNNLSNSYFSACNFKIHVHNSSR